MNGDELAARVRADMGYLVYPSFRELRVGQIVQADATRKLKCVTPLIIVGPATKRHMMRQRRYVANIAPYAGVSMKTAASHFYFVEAAD